MAKPAKAPTKPARTAAKAAISAKPTPCKMSKTGLPLDYRVNAEDMPVTIKLCDAKGAPSVVLQFVSVDASGAPMSPKANTCALNLKKGSYNVNIVIGPAAGADPSRGRLRLGESGADAFTIMKVLGHSSVTTSQRYVHPTVGQVENAFIALEKMTAKELR